MQCDVLFPAVYLGSSNNKVLYKQLCFACCDLSPCNTWEPYAGPSIGYCCLGAMGARSEEVGFFAAHLHRIRQEKQLTGGGNVEAVLPE